MLVKGWLWQCKGKVRGEPMLLIYALISGLLGLGVLVRIAVAL